MISLVWTTFNTAYKKSWLITVPIIFIFRETPEELLELLTTQRALDRRRLEEAFLLFGCLAVMKKYNLSLPDNSMQSMTVMNWHIV